MKNENFNVSVITGNKDSKYENVTYVPLTGKFSKFSPIKDLGLLWKTDIFSFLDQNEIQNPDVVLISGSPFMHFSIAKLFKKKYNSKVILDYRDPFSKNPAFKNSRFKILLKKYIERRNNKYADVLITVNDYCRDLIECFYEKPNAIIQNGYDDTFSPILKPVQTTIPILSYAGKFYFKPTPIFEAVNQLNLTLFHAGPDFQDVENFRSDNIKTIGFVDYNSSVQMVANSDIGIIQTYGEDFQSTTKIFDYIRCEKIILVVSDNFIERGSIYNELINYPNVYWCENNKDAILKTLDLIIKSKYIKPNPTYHEKYSRKFQMNKLLKLISEIIN